MPRQRSKGHIPVLALNARPGRHSPLVAALFCGLLGCSYEPGTPSPPSIEGVNVVEVSQRFRDALDELKEENGFPGATAAFRLSDGRSVAVAVGEADEEEATPMEPESRMLSASIGKTFVAATAVALAREGVLGLDDPVHQWLGEEDWYPRLPNGSDMTLRHLLTHTAGLVDHVYESGFRIQLGKLTESAELRDSRLEPTELIEFALDKEPLFAVGEGYSYTDTGYIVAGLVIEEASGKSYYELVRERFLTPLQLGLTEPADRRQLRALASGYAEPGSPFGEGPNNKVATGSELWLSPATEWTGGGLVSNPLDLVNWAGALYEGSAIDTEAVNEIVESGFRPEAGNEPESLGPDNRYGLGAFVRSTPLGTVWGHAGWFPGYNSMMAYYPERQLALAFQINRSYDNDLGRYLEILTQALLDALSESASG